MPSPVGHALGGLLVGYVAAARPGWRLLAACAVAAAIPDADFLLPIRHRGPSHSVGAALIAFAAALALLWMRRYGRGSFRMALAIGLAYATHVLFDWLGADTSAPRGLMALWPFSTGYYISDLTVFNSVDRRYWSEGFWTRNAVTVARELLILGPLTLLAWWLGGRREVVRRCAPSNLSRHDMR